MNFNKQDKLEIVENAISWIVVMAMLIYGIGKLIQFKGATTVDTPLSDLTGMQLMWAFYGYSQAYALTLGLFEVTGGLLIFFKKTRLLGCLFTSTILVNVILQDIFYEVNVGALRAAILYQLIILIILWLNKERIIQSLKTLLQQTKTEQTWSKLLVKLFIAFGLFAVLRVSEYYITVW